MLQPEPRRSVELPRPPEIAAARRFPLIATLAPIIASAVLFAVTRSAFTLVFALLGPVVAVATTADSALHRARARKREGSRFRVDLEQVEHEIDRVHSVEREDLNRVLPGARAVLDHPSAVGWRAGSHPATTIRLGVGELASGLAMSGAPPIATEDGIVTELAALRSRAERITGAPISADVSDGLGIAGPAVVATSLARAVLVQLAAQLSPDEFRIEAPAEAMWDWIDALPHAVNRGTSTGTIRFESADTAIDLVIAASVAELPRRMELSLLLDGTGDARLVSHREVIGFRAEFVSAQSAVLVADALRRLAMDAGMVRGRDIPQRVEFAGLDQHGGAGLTASIGATDAGPMVVDLASDGPHAIVGGTTGSGKSELLVTWVLGLASERSPSQVTFLFVDFKGGAAFDALARLPHSVGVITDLDAEQSLRALTSLGAELRHRERALAARGLASIDDLADDPPFPRLVVIVDEYAALVETHSSLHTVFADIAARGRSLGVHLVLCTQRPAGVVRDGILANCALRISLRVMSAADSTAVLGSDAAAALPARPPGQALLSVAGGPPQRFQVAHAPRSEARRIAAKWDGVERPRAPWLSPLPARIVRDAVAVPEADGGIAFALEDRTEEQAQPIAFYRPGEHGSLLVIGAARSGKSGVLAALATPSGCVVERLPRALPQLWDALQGAAQVDAPAPRVLLLDDLDAIIAECDENYRAPLLDLLVGVLRDGPARGIVLAATVQRMGSGLQSLAGLFGCTLLLRMPNRQEHLIAGGAAAEFIETLPPGAGRWLGHRVQVFGAEASPLPVHEARAVPLDLETAALAVVSTRPAQFAERLRAVAPARNVVLLGPARFDGGGAGVQVHAGGAPDILVADPDSWQSQWGMFTTLQRGSDLLFDGCSLADVRTLTRSRELPPPFARGERTLWLKPVDGDLVRASLPQPEGRVEN